MFFFLIRTAKPISKKCDSHGLNCNNMIKEDVEMESEEKEKKIDEVEIRAFSKIIIGLQCFVDFVE